MLFNSYIYLLLFLPVAVTGYFFCNRVISFRAGTWWLLGVSLFFYGYWNPWYVPLLIGSVALNYLIARTFQYEDRDAPWYLGSRRSRLIFGIAGNVGLLIYVKYWNFFVDTLFSASGIQIFHTVIALPLAVSFFTFVEITYLVDSYKRITRDYSFEHYILFVTFFPHLIAGPIVHHKQLVPQFENGANRTVRFERVASGLFILVIGLCKKVVIADMFARWVAIGFDGPSTLTFFEAWAVSLSYTMQLYFDFSGYSDMAIGAARMMNIELPQNFNSPYKALTIQDFWRRWHITLSAFLRDYVYIPLGGNKRGEGRMLSNIFLVFLIGGLWHGAGWMFLLWGALHGAAMVTQRIWSRIGITLPAIISWVITFNFVNIAWVFFRAHTVGDAMRILRGMAGIEGVVLPGPLHALGSMIHVPVGDAFMHIGVQSGWLLVGMLLAAFLIVVFTKNSYEIAEQFRPLPMYLFISIFVSVISLYYLGGVNAFIYFQF